MSAVYENLTTLIETFGARPATSEAEARLRDYLARRLQERGLKVFDQPFRTVPSFTAAWLVVSLMYVLSGVGAWFASGAWAILLALLSPLAMALYWGLVSGKWDVMRLFPQRESANLIAIAPARQAVKRRVVLMAHIDSTRATLLWHPNTVKNFGKSFILQTLILGLHTLGALGVMADALTGLSMGWAKWLMVQGTLVSLWGLFVLIHREVVLDWVQGANDNGSGTAVVLTLMERLSENPLDETEVWGVFTGAEEVGTPAGAFAFEREYGWQLHDAEFVIVDHVGLGEPRYLLAEAMLPRQKAHPDMVRRFEDLARHHSEWRLAPSEVPCGAYTDALPFLIGRYQAIALWCEQEPGVPPNWHWRTDTLENVSPQALERVGHLLEVYLRDKPVHSAMPETHHQA
ncbi:MAG: M28 family peptidase [Fimbriimonadales bacterium]